MTKTERLLALDAALCASEGAIEDDAVRQAANVIQTWLESQDFGYPVFGEFLKAQEDACLELACNARVFGDPFFKGQTCDLTPTIF